MATVMCTRTGTLTGTGTSNRIGADDAAEGIQQRVTGVRAKERGAHLDLGDDDGEQLKDLGVARLRYDDLVVPCMWNKRNTQWQVNLCPMKIND
jgi:hypothetical protein